MKAHPDANFLIFENVITGCAFVGGGGIYRTPGDKVTVDQQYKNIPPGVLL